MSDSTTFALPSDVLGQARRSPMEMVCDILDVVSEGPTKPTHILYKANMSWKVLAVYLEYLIGRGLVDKEEQGGKRSTYTLTLKGKSILELYNDLKLSLTGGTVPPGRELIGLLGKASTVRVPQTASHVW
jgi:predicted transcriptional regulator